MIYCKRYSLSVSFLLALLLTILGSIHTVSRCQSYRGDEKNSAQYDANTIRAWVTNYGNFFRHPLTGNSGFEWPQGRGLYAIYAAGLWLGAKVNGEARVAVAEYSYEYQPGTIDDVTYLPNDLNDSRFRVYKINRGVTDSWDYRHWPYEDGAPLDADGNPLIIGDQTLWCVYNDADTNVHINMGSLPLGVEVQQTVFGWERQSPTEGFLFIRWLIINKSIHNLVSLYVNIWSDPDLGDSGDDFVGCDTVNSLGYCYNSSNNDGEYGEKPPAVGFQILQGPLVSSPSDSGIYMGYKRSGFKNLPMTSFVNCVSSNEINGFPQTAQDVYYIMQSRWRNGQKITYGDRGIDPNTPPTNFMYSGDPESGEGWVDSSPADRVMYMGSGPFHLAPGDSQDVVVAAIIARGGSNLKSVTRLKNLAYGLKYYYNNYMYKLLRSYPGTLFQKKIVDKLELLQNYPNPFNNRTRLKYQLPIARTVRLEIFNTLGEKVATLVNEHQEPDIYEVVWNASGLPSGIYFAYFQVAQYQLIRKLLLLK